MGFWVSVGGRWTVFGRMLVLLVLGDLIGEEGVHAAVLHAWNTNCILIILME